MNCLERIDKILSNIGYGSRKEVKALIKSGAVEIDNKIVNDSSLKINPVTHIIKVDGFKIDYKKHIYIMMNKPQGFVSSKKDKRNKTIFDLLDENYVHHKLHSVGRLDKDTEGLIILTNDGQFTHNLTSPKKGIIKTYYAKIQGNIKSKYEKDFASGIVLEDGYKCLPAKLEIIEDAEISKIKISIAEGKFHQIKRMFKAIGKEVIFLKRISIGSLSLDASLLAGEYRELKEKELRKLQNNN